MAAIFARVVGNSRLSEFRCGQFHYWFIVGRRRRRGAVRVCRVGGSSCHRSSAVIFSHRLCGRFPDQRCALHNAWFLNTFYRPILSDHEYLERLC